MHDCLIDANDDVVEWQSASRKRVDHEAKIAAEQANDRLRADSERRRELLFIKKVTQDFSLPQKRPGLGNPAYASGLADLLAPSKEQSGSTAQLAEEWRERVRTIPDIRSAFIPLDEMDDGIDWSNAFSLPKANLEPWLSFFKGYKKSSLFVEPARPVHTESAGQQTALQLQFEVRAILELRNLGAKIILEPAVQINYPVEYLDLIGELEGCRDHTHAQALAKITNEVHESRLEQAVEKGREMGDRLYHALLGPDYTNLAKEWVKIHKRKPSIDEMHCMLTTGRVRILPAKQPATADARENLRRDNPCAPGKHITAEKPRVAPEAKAKSHQYNADTTNRKAEFVARQIIEETCKHNRKRKILRHLFQFTICCAALVTHVFAV